LVYVGLTLTKRPLKIRIAEHKAAIRHMQLRGIMKLIIAQMRP